MTASYSQAYYDAIKMKCWSLTCCMSISQWRSGGELSSCAMSSLRCVQMDNQGRQEYKGNQVKPLWCVRAFIVLQYSRGSIWRRLWTFTKKTAVIPDNLLTRALTIRDALSLTKDDKCPFYNTTKKILFVYEFFLPGRNKKKPTDFIAGLFLIHASAHSKLTVFHVYSNTTFGIVK